MSRIVPTDWQTQVRIFEKYGCTFKRQKGDHMVFVCPGAKRAVVIPKYRKVGVAIILNNMKTVGMSREQYFKLLESC